MAVLEHICSVSFYRFFIADAIGMRRDRASSAGIPRKKFIDFFSLALPTVQSSPFTTIVKGTFTYLNKM
jgi:hypothetical protein